MERPLCEGMDPNIFFPPEDIYDVHSVAQAKSICLKCPVYDWCKKTYSKEQHGVFFATTPAERSRNV